MTSSPNRRRTAQLAVTATACLSLVGAAVASPSANASAYDDDLKAVRTATARFHSTGQAVRAGYEATPVCVSIPSGPAMGIHYENAALMADPAIDPRRPEVLLYAPGEDGRLELVAVEYYRSATGATGTPVLFGIPFDGPTPAHHPGMDTHYDLHVWLWEPNPAGTFAPFNPAVSC